MTARRGARLAAALVTAAVALAGCGVGELAVTGQPVAAPTAAPAVAHPASSPAQVRFRPLLLDTTPSTSPSGSAQSAVRRQSTDRDTQRQEMLAMACPKADPLRDRDDPKRPLVTCDQDASTIFLLDSVVLDGTELTGVAVQKNPDGADWVVDIDFTPAGQRAWATFTTANVDTEVAITVDTRVVTFFGIGTPSAGNDQYWIYGRFTERQAEDLAAAID
jgi:preprotein translocase subunit SecD